MNSENIEIENRIEENEKSEMNHVDKMKGKDYLIVGILCVICLGLIIFGYFL